MAPKRHVQSISICYLVLVLALGALLGLVRTIALIFGTDQPHPYPMHSVLVNGGMAVLVGVTCFPALLAAYLRISRSRDTDPARAATLGSIIGVVPLFWVLTTPLGFWRPVSEDLLAVFKEVVSWLAILLGVIFLWRTLFLSKPARLILVRSGVLFAVLVLATLGMGVYASFVYAAPKVDLQIQPSAKYTPNIFLILVDTLRADHLGAYGYDLPTSLNVDQLARTGIRYSMAIAPAPWTKPSCAALLTSLYPPDMQVSPEFAPVPAQVPLLPQFLKAEGYATAGIVSSVWITRMFGFDKGFDLLDIGKTKYHWAGLKVPLVRLGLVERRHSYPRYNAQQLTDRAIHWIDDHRARGKPLFMYLHYADPHAPYEPPPGEDRWRDFARGQGRSLPKPPSNPPRGDTALSEAEFDALKARYDAEISYFDTHFGRLIEYLKSTQVFSDSLIVLTADHGEEFLDHGGYGHSKTLYNELVRVPLIVKLPSGLSRPNDLDLDQPVSLVDVAATVADVLQAGWDTSGWRGSSLLQKAGDRSVYADNAKPPLRAVYSRSGKLIQTLAADGQPLEEKYYSLSVDFGEKSDGLPPETVSPTTMAQMRKELAETYSKESEDKRVEVDSDTLEHMRALGYGN